MKSKLSFLAVLALAATGYSAEYTRFRVCQDQRVIQTSDGAEAGHVEYIVVEPTSQRVVSTVVTGGVIGEKFVAVPFESMRFGTANTIVLNEITRERLVSAPVIERTQFTSTTVVEPALIERSSTHFGVRVDATTRTGSNRTDVNVRDGDRPGDARAPGRNGETTTTDRTTVNGRATTETNRDPNNARERDPNNGRRGPAETTTKDQPPRDREKEQGRDAQRTQDSPDRANEKGNRPPEKTATEKNATEKGNRPPEKSATEKAATEKTDHAPDKNDRTPEKNDRTTDKPDRTPDKIDRTSEKQPADKGDRTPDKNDRTDKIDRTPEKPAPDQATPEKGNHTPEKPNPSGKTDEKTDHTPAHPEKKRAAEGQS